MASLSEALLFDNLATTVLVNNRWNVPSSREGAVRCLHVLLKPVILPLMHDPYRHECDKYGLTEQLLSMLPTRYSCSSWNVATPALLTDRQEKHCV